MRRWLFVSLAIVMAIVFAPYAIAQSPPVNMQSGTFTSSSSTAVGCYGNTGQSSAWFQVQGATGPLDADGWNGTQTPHKVDIYDVNGTKETQPFTPTANAFYRLFPSGLQNVEVYPDVTFGTISMLVTVRCSASQEPIAPLGNPSSAPLAIASPLCTPPAGNALCVDALNPTLAAPLYPSPNPSPSASLPPANSITQSAPWGEVAGSPAPSPSAIPAADVTCDQFTTASGASSNTVMITGVTSSTATIYLCGWLFVNSGTANGSAQIGVSTSGTGCGATRTNLTPAIPLLVSAPFYSYNPKGALLTTAGTNAVCLYVAGSGTIGAIIWYARF